MAAEGDSSEKANVIWQIALNARESAEVRRTATFLTGQVGDNRTRPSNLNTLLRDSDTQVVVFALENSTMHLDQRNYDLIRTKLINSSDIHVRVASVHAIGTAAFDDRQSVLTSVIASVLTSKVDEFSESSLLKRAAISHLDMRNPAIFEAVKNIALDDNEDAGVRAKAIGRFMPMEFPGEVGMLLELLKKLDADNAVALRAIVDVLLTAPTPERVEAIRSRADELSDAEVRKLLLRRIEIATQGGNL